MLKNLKKLRIEFGMSQKQLADVVNVSQQSINKYENHDVEPDISTLCAFADIFGTSIDYIVGRKDDEKHSEREPVLLSDEECRILSLYRFLSQKSKSALDIIIEQLK